MATDYTKRKSRLSKIEEKKSLKQALRFILLTIVLLALIIFYGIPALIKLVVFLGDLKSSDQRPDISDTLAPTPPIIEPIAEATNSSVINIKGYTEEGATVKLFIGGINSKEVVTDKSGSFVFDTIKLKTGENEFKLKAQDKAGNESEFSKTSVVIFDNEPPPLEITNPQNGAEFFEKDREITIQGSSDENIRILVNNRLAYTDSEGNFSTRLELTEGKNQIIIKAIDKAGNETKKEIEVSYSP